MPSALRNPPFLRAIPPDTAPIARTDYLSYWLAETDDAPTARLWRLFQTDRFADLWYGAREAGERLRARTLSTLSLSRRIPGGAHPDPREPAAFSANAILAGAARTLGLSIWQIPEHIAAVADANAPLRTPQWAWLMTYPEQRPPDIATRAASATSATSDSQRQQFSIACILGFACKERARLTDPDAPAGIILLPQDPAVVSILHQFAIGLLSLPRDCPDESPCACNNIRERFNAPPPDHQQPTDALSLANIQQHIQQQQEQQDMRRITTGPLG